MDAPEQSASPAADGHHTQEPVPLNDVPLHAIGWTRLRSDPQRPVTGNLDPSRKAAQQSKGGTRPVRPNDEVERTMRAVQGPKVDHLADMVHAPNPLTRPDIHPGPERPLKECPEQDLLSQPIRDASQGDLAIIQADERKSIRLDGGHPGDDVGLTNDIIEDPHPSEDRLTGRLEHDPTASRFQARGPLEDGDLMPDARQDRGRRRAGHTQTDHGDSISSRLTTHGEPTASRLHPLTKSGASLSHQRNARHHRRDRG